MGVTVTGPVARGRSWVAGLVAVAGALTAGAVVVGQEAGAGRGVDEPAAIEQLIDALKGPALDGQEEAALLQEGFDQFMARMDAWDGPSAVGLALALHSRANAVWSAFCAEGALRRSAPADARGESALDAYAVADGLLMALLREPELGEGDRLAVVQRRAILAAGFGDESGERASLGRALVMGSTDGGQILGLKALLAGDALEAARLFGHQLDRGDPPESCPWALRGHALASLAALRGRR